MIFFPLAVDGLVELLGDVEAVHYRLGVGEQLAAGGVERRAHVGLGDFALDPWGVPRRRREREVVPYLYAGVQIVAPSLLIGTPEGAFSMNQAWDAAMAAGRLRAVVHDGLWFHLSTPADLAEAETILQARLTGETR